jgi:hypothetical protein
MRAVIGIDRKIKRAWLDVLLDHLARSTDHEELRRFVDEHLAEELPGAASRAKSVGISLKIWSGIPANRVFLRDRAIALLPKISGQERVWLHWGMTTLAYPFFRDTAEVVGRLLTLQDDFTTAQVQERLLKKWGDRATTKEAAQKLLTTLLDWEVLRSAKTKGHFLLVSRRTTHSTALQLWLLEALLAASSAGEVEAQQLLRLPEMFPFTLSIGLSDLRRHDGFHLHRQGLDMDMVSVRPVKIETPAKPSPRKKPARKPQQVAPTLFHEGNGEPPKKPALPPIIPTIEAVAASERPIDRPHGRPEPTRISPVAEEVAAAEPEQPSDQAPVGHVRRADRLATVGVLDLPQEMPFRAPIGECLRLFHEGLDFACIALAHDTIDAILRLICRVKLGPRQAKCADIRSQFGGLSAIGVLPTALKTRLEKLWYERVDYLELDAAEDLDRSALEGAASSHISTLVELVQQFLGHSSDQGKVVPDHAEYWTLGKKKLPFQAGTAG